MKPANFELRLALEKVYIFICAMLQAVKAD